MLRVMTLNLNYYVTKYGPWDRRRVLIKDAIQAGRPDIIALQAVRRDPAVEDGVDQAQQLARLLPEYVHAIFQPAMQSSDGVALGSAFLSRLQIVETDHRKLSFTPGLEDPNQRILLHICVEVAGERLQLFNAHFSWVYQQARDNVSEAIQYLARYEQPRMLVGDLNILPDSELLEPMRQAGLVDAWAKLHPEDPGFTFEPGALDRRIDYVWLDQRLSSRLAGIEIVAHRPSPEGVWGSDHFGLLATL